MPIEGNKIKLIKLQKACGSLTNLLKIRGGADADELQPADNEGTNVTATDAEQETGDGDQKPIEVATSSSELFKQSSIDMQQKMSNQIDKLDLLLTKSENAQYSMEHQNKQIKSFLKK